MGQKVEAGRREKVERFVFPQPPPLTGGGTGGGRVLLFLDDCDVNRGERAKRAADAVDCLLVVLPQRDELEHASLLAPSTTYSVPSKYS